MRHVLGDEVLPNLSYITVIALQMPARMVFRRVSMFDEDCSLAEQKTHSFIGVAVDEEKQKGNRHSVVLSAVACG